MLSFYKSAFVLSVAAALLSAGLVYFGLVLSVYTISLLPRQQADGQWFPYLDDDTANGGGSHITASGTDYAIEYEFNIKSGVPYPFATFALNFASRLGDPSGLRDFSTYTKASIGLKCNQKNILSFTAFAFETGFSTPDDIKTYRPATAYFPCERNRTQVEIDLRDLEVPDWWLQVHQKPLSNKHYNLGKTLRLVFGNSVQSPLDVTTEVTIDDFILEGRNWWWVYSSIAGALITWILLIVWCIRLYSRALTAEVKNQLQRDLPLIAYQQLSIEPRRDKEKSAVLHYIASQYSNPDLSVETAIAALGINRNKINDLLKAEIGLTFTAYLNKIRLTEAARLLAANPDLSIAEAAYSVGYNNVSYFNKLFKAEYHCTPKTFQSASNVPPTA